MLLGIARLARSIVGKPAARERAEVEAEDPDAARRGAIEPGQHPQKRRLPGSARPEDDDHLSLGDAEGQPLEGRRAYLFGREDAEEVADLDHASASAERTTSWRNALQVSTATSPTTSAA